MRNFRHFFTKEKWFKSNLPKIKNIMTQFGLGVFVLSIIFACQKDQLLSDPEIEIKNIHIEKMASIETNSHISLQKPITIGYYPSWSEGWLNEDGKSKFTTLPTTISHVFFAFARPNMRYTKNSFDLSKTGLECYANDGNMLKRAVGILKQRGISVILSIGGESYWATDEAYDINYQQIKDLVDDIGFVGIDWDFEPNGSFDESGSVLNVQRLSTFISESRKLMPKSAGYIIATAPAGVGALGGQLNDDLTSPYAYAKRNSTTGEPDAGLYQLTNPGVNISLYGLRTTGAMIPVIKKVGSEIDIIAYQAYNTGAAPNRRLLYDAYAYYANIYGFKLAHGTHVPNEPWGPYYEYTPQIFAELAEYIYQGGNQGRLGKNDGLMIWNLNSLSAKGTNYTGITYLNVANKILNGESISKALTNAFDYQNQTPNIPTNPTKPTEPITGGGCGVEAYNSSKSYPTAGTKVYYQGKIYTSKWWVNANQIPEAEQWGPWEFVENCDGNVTTNSPDPSNFPAPEDTAEQVKSITDGGCGIAAYNSSKSYPKIGSEVYYKGKIFKNKWWVNPNQKPESEDWGPWEFIRECVTVN